MPPPVNSRLADERTESIARGRATRGFRTTRCAGNSSAFGSRPDHSPDHLALTWPSGNAAAPQGAKIEKIADGYGYDVRALPRKNVMLTSSFSGWSN